MIEVSGARCRVGRHGLLEIEHWRIEPGQHWGVFGPNGAGKTLAARLLCGDLRQSSRLVNYAAGFEPGRHCFSVSFEEQQRLCRLDQRHDISEFAASAHDPGTRVGALIASARPAEESDPGLVERLLRQLGLEDLADRGIRYLSSGQQRRALLARALYGALASSQRLLVLDDVLASIDRDSRQRIEDCIGDFMQAGFASLHLCRRAGEIPEGLSHLALMQDLSLKASGSAAAIRQSELFAELANPRPRLPDSLPLSGQEDASRRDEQSGVPLIELQGVEAGYGDLPVLRDIDWVMKAGDQVLIEGPNGCGKSTLLSLIDGENHKGYGQSLRLFGRQKGSGESVWEIKSRFGIVSNELHNKYIRGWRVLDVVVSGFFDSVGLYDDSGSREKQAARDWLEALSIAELAKRYYHELSFGQQRLVLLARAMVKQPRVLVLDEPCVGLDDFHRRLILGLVDLIVARSATQIIYVSHVPEEEPGCINSRLRFVSHERGGHTLRQE